MFEYKNFFAGEVRAGILGGHRPKTISWEIRNFLLTLDVKEAERVVKKIADGSVVGIDAAFDCNTDAVDELICELRTYRIVQAGTIGLIKKGILVAG